MVSSVQVAASPEIDNASRKIELNIRQKLVLLACLQRFNISVSLQTSWMGSAHNFWCCLGVNAEFPNSHPGPERKTSRKRTHVDLCFRASMRLKLLSDFAVSRVGNLDTNSPTQALAFWFELVVSFERNGDCVAFCKNPCRFSSTRSATRVGNLSLRNRFRHVLEPTEADVNFAYTLNRTDCST